MRARAIRALEIDQIGRRKLLPIKQCSKITTKPLALCMIADGRLTLLIVDTGRAGALTTAKLAELGKHLRILSVRRRDALQHDTLAR